MNEYDIDFVNDPIVIEAATNVIALLYKKVKTKKEKSEYIEAIKTYLTMVQEDWDEEDYDDEI